MALTRSDHRGSQSFADSVSFLGAVSLPPDDDAGTNAATGAVGDLEISENAAKRISHGKLVQRLDLNYAQAEGADVATAEAWLYQAAEALTLLAVSVRPSTAPTGGDKQYTVAVDKSDDGGATWSTLLAAAVTVGSSSVDNTKQDATLAATPTLADGDLLRVVVTASGSTGSQGQGVCVSIAAHNQ